MERGAGSEKQNHRGSELQSHRATELRSLRTSEPQNLRSRRAEVRDQLGERVGVRGAECRCYFETINKSLNY